MQRDEPVRHIFAAQSIVCQQTAHQYFTAWFSFWFSNIVSIPWLLSVGESLERDGDKKCNRCAI